MRQGFYLIVAVTFIIGHAFAHVTGHSPAETKGFQFVAHHEVAESGLQTAPTNRGTLGILSF